MDQTWKYNELEKGEEGRIERTYPKISRTGIKVQVKCLCRRTDAHRSKIEGVILYIFCGDFSSSASSGLLLKDHLHVGSATIESVSSIFALLMDLVPDEVRSLSGRLESVLLQKPDI